MFIPSSLCCLYLYLCLYLSSRIFLSKCPAFPISGVCTGSKLVTARHTMGPGSDSGKLPGSASLFHTEHWTHPVPHWAPTSPGPNFCFKSSFSPPILILFFVICLGSDRTWYVTMLKVFCDEMLHLPTLVLTSGSAVDTLKAVWLWNIPAESTMVAAAGVDILKAAWFWSGRFRTSCESQCTLRLLGKPVFVHVRFVHKYLHFHCLFTSL